MLLLDSELWNPGVQTAGTCWAVENGLQGQAVHRASWVRVWWEGIATWAEPEMTEENTQQHFAHSIQANVFLFYASHEPRHLCSQFLGCLVIC